MEGREQVPGRAAVMGGLRAQAARSVTAAVGSAPVAAAWRRARPGLRILAYHDVPDPDRFAEHLDLLVAHHTPVSGAEVVAARRGGAALPPDAVWVTFDDGHPSVAVHARDVLLARQVPATVFVCPGLVTDGRRPWWETVLAAGEVGRGATFDGTDRSGPALVRALKVVPDHRRREVVAELEDAAPAPEGAAALTLDQLRVWQDSGLEVGNHTWDHPCLDRCTTEEQTRQIERAHEWLVSTLAPPDLLFAYPNGDHTAHALEVLQGLDYGAILLFDHRINPVRAVGAPELSRLRLDAGAPPARARAVLSGAHADLFGLLG